MRLATNASSLIQSLTGRVTYLEQFAPKPNSAKVLVAPPTNPNALYAARQHTHQAKDITSGVLSIAFGGTGGNDKNTARRGLGLGTASTYNVPQTGNAANQVSLGNNGRFTDARVPLPHAASHATGRPDTISPDSTGLIPPDLQYNLRPSWQRKYRDISQSSRNTSLVGVVPNP